MDGSEGGSDNVPGPVTALSPANNDASQFWVAGKNTNGSAFLLKYDGSSFTSVGYDLGTDTTIRGLAMFQLSQKHDTNKLVDAGMVLLITGQLELPNFGNASAALFNGTNFTPSFCLPPGTIRAVSHNSSLKRSSPTRVRADAWRLAWLS